MNRFVINEDQIATLTKIIGNDRVTTILRAHPYDPQIERGVALDELKSWCVQMKCNGCPYGGVLFGKITELRQAGEQEANRD
jgi:hypothetical protein